MASYYVWSGAAGTGTGASWANAYTTLTLAFASKAAGDVFYVAHDHAQSSAVSISLNHSPGTSANPQKIMCVDRAGSVPPVSADRRATAQVLTTGNTDITFLDSGFYDGIIFIAGNSTGNANIFVNAGDGHFLRFDNCSLRIGSTGTGNRIQMPTSSYWGPFLGFNNTTFSFSNAAQSILSNGGTVRWISTPSAILGTNPAILFLLPNGSGTEIECIGVDLSALGSGCTIVGGAGTTNVTRARFVDCKLNALVTKTVAVPGPGTRKIDFVRSSATGNYAVTSVRYQGTLTEETTIVRTSGGATDGVTPISWKIVTTANSNYSSPFESPPIAIWNDTTGSAKTATIECVWGGGAVPLDSEIWVDVEYLGDASSPQGSFINDGAANLLTAGANQTSSSATWGGSTTKFKLNVTFTAQQKGWVYARVKCAKASSTFYVDPLVTLT